VFLLSSHQLPVIFCLEPFSANIQGRQSYFGPDLARSTLSVYEATNQELCESVVRLVRTRCKGTKVVNTSSIDLRRYNWPVSRGRIS